MAGPWCGAGLGQDNVSGGVKLVTNLRNGRLIRVVPTKTEAEVGNPAASAAYVTSERPFLGSPHPSKPAKGGAASAIVVY